MIKLNLELDADNAQHMRAAELFFGALKGTEALKVESPKAYRALQKHDAERAVIRGAGTMEQKEEALTAHRKEANAERDELLKAQDASELAEAEALEAERKAVKAARDKSRREKIKAEKEAAESQDETEESEEADTEEGTDEDETKLTLNDVRSIVSEKAKLAGAREKIVAELKDYGVENTTKLDSKYYGAFVRFLKTLS